MFNVEMEPPTKKQRTVQGGYNGTEASRSPLDMVDTSGAAGCPTLPSLVFAIFIETLSVDVLKFCRLVCKSWNHAACKELRARSCVSLSENKQGLKDFKKLVFDGDFFPEMPFPFQNIKAYGHSFKNASFNDFLHIPFMVIESLMLPLVGNTDQKELEKLLVAKGPRIKTLVLNVRHENYRFRPNPALLANEQIQLSGLKNLQLWEICPRNLNNFKLIKKLTQYSALEKIVLMIKDANILDQILSPVNLLTIKILKLVISQASTKDFEQLENLHMPSLRDLEVRVHKMWDKGQENSPNEGKFQQIASFVENVSSTIKVLTSNVLRLKLLPVCPKLEEIHVYEFKSCVSDFSLDTFPALTSINFSVITCWRRLENGFIPHPKVTEVSIDVAGSPFEGIALSDDDDSFYMFLKSLNRQFPNIQKLSFPNIPFTPQIFRDINQAFPRLKALRIDSSRGFDSITGMRIYDLHYYLAFDWPVENVPQRNSFLEFKGIPLVFLDLVGLGVTISRKMILDCLGKIPTLKFLKFYWNHQLYSQDVRDSLGHLEKIFVINLFPAAGKHNHTHSEMTGYVNTISKLDARDYLYGISELEELPNVYILAE